MRRIFYSRFGGPEFCSLEHTAIPQLAPDRSGSGGRLRCESHRFQNPQWTGFCVPNPRPAFSFVPGYDVSGVVDALSDGVSQWAPGDAVYGMVNFPLPAGACAEYVVADAGTWARAPQSIPGPRRWFAACGPLTAWQALFDVGGLQSGERVLVLAGAGGVGHLSVQLAAWKGASVSATASPANHDFLRRHGAALALDYHDP